MSQREKELKTKLEEIANEIMLADSHIVAFANLTEMRGNEYSQGRIEWEKKKENLLNEYNRVYGTLNPGYTIS